MTGRAAPQPGPATLIDSKSWEFYTHFSLLKSLEAGFGLPCLNHACDWNVGAMSDLFK